ncbi:hypothetical protein [Geobacillus phage GR1]|nr:hypothetical protein [Geobacillus phage GR1]
MTPYDFTALVEHHGRMKKDEYQVLRNTIYNAGVNLLRKKNQKEIPLFSEDRENEGDEKEKLIKEREALFGEISK